jgi:hypothetical protein
MRDKCIQEGVEYSTNFLVSEKDASILEGRLLTLVELLGLPTEQSEALKSEIRQRLWAGCFVNRNTTTIYAHNVPEVREFISKLKPEVKE